MADQLKELEPRNESFFLLQTFETMLEDNNTLGVVIQPDEIECQPSFHSEYFP